MKIIISNFEASEIIREHFQKAAHPNVDIKSVEIESAETADPNKKTVELMPLIQAIQNSSAPYQGSHKIAAIKAIRLVAESQGLHIGLGDAKLFVEQFIP